MAWPTSRVPLAAVQAAVYERITTANPTYSVFAFPQIENPPLPFTVLSRMRASSDDTKDSNGCVVTYTLDVYSQTMGMMELDGILNGIIGALTASTLIVDDDWDMVEFNYSWTAATEPGDEKGPIQHGTIELMIRLDDAS